MYKGVNKDKRDKAQLMLIEKKLRAELEELKQQMRRLQVNSFFSWQFKQIGVTNYGRL